MPRTSIAHTRNIIQAVKDKYGYDFSMYSLTSLRYKLDRIISGSFVNYPDLLVKQIVENEGFFDEFLYRITASESSLFRDREVWTLMGTVYLGYLFRNFDLPQIWIGDASFGADLQSFLLLMERYFPERDLKVYFSWMSEKYRDILRKRSLRDGIITASRENFAEVMKTDDIGKYYETRNKTWILPERIWKNTLDFREYPDQSRIPQKFHLIIYRNRLLGFSSDYQNLILDNIVNAMHPGGILILGYRENIDDYLESSPILEVADGSENIYKKKSIE